MTDIFNNTPGNVIAEDSALSGCGGLVIFEEPIFGFADAEDELFEQFKKPEIIGEPYLSPTEWLPLAKTVVSFFKAENQCKDAGDLHFSSSWSERHAAFAAGLGTFSRTRGLITGKGVAGRFGSMIVSGEYETTERPYHEVEEYCIRCGACVLRCPVGAISMEHGKNQTLCREWVEEHTAEAYYPWYGCGKSQVGVPCESKRPERGESTVLYSKRQHKI